MSLQVSTQMLVWIVGSAFVLTALLVVLSGTWVIRENQ